MIKTEVMCWLRYAKRLPIVCTEVGPWNSDVIGIGDDMLIEVEVKASKADLKRDFTGKATKWHTYINNEQSHSVPNYMYVACPEAMSAEALAIVSEKAPKVGLIEYLDTDLLPGRNIRCLKKPTRMRIERPSERMKKVAMARMSSELCGMKVTAEALRTQISNKIDKMFDETAMAAYRVAGTLDCEINETLDRIAAELAFCVNGIEWENEDKDKWRQAARLWIEAQNAKRY